MIKKFELKDFRVDRLLVQEKNKMVILCHYIKTNEPAVLHFIKKDSTSIFFDYAWMKSKLDKLTLNVNDENDHHYMTKVHLFKQDINCLFIWPANQKYINHYEMKSVKCLETAQSYRKYTKKYIKETPSCKWITNILEGKAEKKEVLLRDDDPELGFVLTRNEFLNTSDSVSYCAFVAQDLKSVRDLKAKHIPLLQNILRKSKAAISALTGLKSNEIVNFAHYHPNYWRLHFHFRSRLKDGAPYLRIEKLISWMKKDPDAMQKKTLEVMCKVPALMQSIQKEDSPSTDNDTQQLIEEDETESGCCHILSMCFKFLFSSG